MRLAEGVRVGNLCQARGMQCEKGKKHILGCRPLFIHNWIALDRSMYLPVQPTVTYRMQRCTSATEARSHSFRLLPLLL